MDATIEKSALRKIYIRLLPFAILSYFLAYVDRINVSFAALTMRDDLQMSATAYGFALGHILLDLFYFRGSKQHRHGKGWCAAVDCPDHDYLGPAGLRNRFCCRSDKLWRGAFSIRRC